MTGATSKLAAILLAVAVLPLYVRGQADAELSTLAVGSFTYKGHEKFETDIGLFGDALQAHLVNSRKFTLVERSRLDEAFKEQGLSAANLVASRIQQIGQLVGAQFIAYGSVTEIAQESIAGMNLATISLDINVMDATAGSVKWSGQVKARSRGTLGDAVREAARQASRRIMFSIYPITVASVHDGELMLNYGSDYIDEGQLLSVYHLGDPIIDPATGRMLGKNETHVGVAIVYEALDRFSKAAPDEISKTRNLEPGMICRLIDESAPPPPGPYVINIDIDITEIDIQLCQIFNITINGIENAPIAPDRRPTAALEITFSSGVASPLTNELGALEQLLRNYLTDGGLFDVVDRGEFTNLVGERVFSQFNSPAGEQKRMRRDASADYVITISVSELRSTAVKRGSLLTQYVGLVSARIVDTERGTPLASVRTEIKDFFPSGAQAVNALATKLASDLNASARKELAGEDALAKGTPAGQAAELTILRVRPNGEIMVSDDHNVLSIGDELAVYAVDEFPDPRDPSIMLKDEIMMGTIKVERKGASGAFARAITPGVTFEPLMIARKQMASAAKETTGAISSENDTAMATDPRSEIAQTGVKPTLHIGKFKYSQEFDLSQTADRTSGSNAGSGSLAVLGAVAGGLIKGGKPEEWIPAAVVGGAVGEVADNELEKSGDRRERSREDQANSRQQQAGNDRTAITKESAVLREMVLTKAHASQRFQIIEDARLDEIEDYMNRETNGNFDASSLVKRGNLQSAKYSAFGTILRFETNSKRKGYSIAGGSEKVEMTLTMALRLVDNETGRVVVSDQISGSIDTGSSQVGFLGFGTASENQGAIGELMDVLARNVMAKIVTTLYPIQVIDVNVTERVVMINAGKTVVNRLDRLTVFQAGEKVYDPYSGMELGSSEQEVGEIEVFEVQARFSKARIIRPVKDIGLIIKRGNICRPAVEKTSAMERPERKGGF